ncbi:MAG: J domain-containing protein [Alphaproteobacteria bacterium]|jgi:DnaJ-class molecular chaperone|nr:J domain-containing protein [Alphaproteobacteria bacterium]MDP6515229.1 J domain-containing protein [Alphaproteobacteria bacterium]
MSDPYKMLGVGRDASQDDIKKAYRKLAKALHPDLHPGDQKVENKFKEASAAYTLLSDPDTRARFDRGEIDASGQERPDQRFYRSHAGAGGGTHQRGFGGGLNIDDLFSDLFAGAARGPRRNARGQDATYTLRVGFLDAACGATKRMTLPDGRTLDVTIPEGIAEGQKIRLKGQGGSAGGAGPAGDAFIEVAIEADSDFRRDGVNVEVALPISLPEAMLGAKVEVPTVHGPVTMTIPEGSNSGDRLRLKGRGIRDAKSKVRGDQYVELKVMLPDPPDPALTEMVEGWAKAHPYSVRASK